MTPPASSEVLAPGRLSTVAGYSCVVGVSMSRTWLAALSGLLCALLSNASVAGTTSDSPQQSLDRMVRAGQTMNYDGTFVYRNGATMQSMRIIHRFGDDGERERLVALSGAAREVLRDRERVTCILPDRQSVVVAKSRPRNFPHSKLFESDAGFAGFYTLSVHGGERIAGRHTKLVAVSPHDRFRYGYRLWMDLDTGLLLKSELINEHGEVVEQLVYTNITLPAAIPDALLEPEISGAGYTWYRDDEVAPAATSGEPSWYPGWLPDGFALSDHGWDPIPASGAPVEHLVFSDGLASVSIFVERLDTASKPLAGLDSMGAVNAYGTMVGEFQITVVGEVPAVTVERLAASIARR
jgi:sigma-E factor negative regulatory protein RseB